MKLRNKKTGEIVKNVDIVKLVKMATNEIIGIELLFTDKDDFKNRMMYSSLEAFNEEWEDYEEPKELYWINCDGTISHAEEGTMSFKNQKQIGNYFGTKEEAEKAVEKLKAWKRLKDKGFKFTGWEDLNTLDPEDSLLVNRDVVDGECVIGFRMTDYSDCIKDLDLLFGGEDV